MRCLARQLLIAFVFALVVRGVQEAAGLPFWPTFAIYALGALVSHALDWVSE